MTEEDSISSISAAKAKGVSNGYDLDDYPGHDTSPSSKVDVHSGPIENGEGQCRRRQDAAREGNQFQVPLILHICIFNHAQFALLKHHYVVVLFVFRFLTAISFPCLQPSPVYAAVIFTKNGGQEIPAAEAEMASSSRCPTLFKEFWFSEDAFCEEISDRQFGAATAPLCLFPTSWPSEAFLFEQGCRFSM
ncbi:hypothetical protein KSP40_PGU012631 [Platanthera guangdongensis]|uniref:Uncharacterized protein n=1 Tax=Platanthera guangdongensis TaxID=2320717 RepID=A0ABR2LE13_9ASPA